jgi:serine O-acetyltransferase
MLADVLEDIKQLTPMATGRSDWRSMLQVALHYDSFAVTAMQRCRTFARQYHLIGLNHALRVVQTAMHGIEIGKDVQLGHGVWFIHPLAIVIGGNSKIGNRVRFFGSNTVGQSKEDGYPTLEDDVWVGAGARVLGNITVGARSMIGANAVVLQDVPPDSVAIGIPARIIPKKRSYQSTPP